MHPVDANKAIPKRNVSKNLYNTELLHEIPDICPKQHSTTGIGTISCQTSENFGNLGERHRRVQTHHLIPRTADTSCGNYGNGVATGYLAIA